MAYSRSPLFVARSLAADGTLVCFDCIEFGATSLGGRQLRFQSCYSVLLAVVTICCAQLQELVSKKQSLEEPYPDWQDQGACQCAVHQNVLGLEDPVGVAGRQAPAKWIQMSPSLQRSMGTLTSRRRNAEHVMPASAVTGQTRSMHRLICVMDLFSLALILPVC